MSTIRNEQNLSARAGETSAARALNGARSSIEGEIRDLVRRNVSQLKTADSEPAMPFRRPSDGNAEGSTHHVNELIRGVSGASIEEIERVMRELAGLREMLRTEGERVTREIAGFASLSHAAVTSMRVIADSLAEWKNGAQIRPDTH